MWAFALCPAAQQSLGLPYSAGKRDSLTTQPPNSSSTHTYIFTIDQGRSDLSLKSAFLSQKKVRRRCFNCTSQRAARAAVSICWKFIALFCLAPAQISRNFMEKNNKDAKGYHCHGFIFNEKQKGCVFQLFTLFLYVARIKFGACVCVWQQSARHSWIWRETYEINNKELDP